MNLTNANIIGMQYKPTFPLRLTLTEVTPGLPAARAGLQAGDVITKVNDVELDEQNIADLSTLLASPPGTTIRLTVRHAECDQNEEVELVLLEPSVNEALAAMRSEVAGRLAENSEDPGLRELPRRAVWPGVAGRRTVGRLHGRHRDPFATPVTDWLFNQFVLVRVIEKYADAVLISFLSVPTEYRSASFAR